MKESKIIFHLKQEVKNKYIMELRIYSTQNKRYPDCIKYSLIMIDPKSKKKVLMDNHHPKGHPFHLDHSEFEYNYKNEETLIEDFKNLVLQHFGEII